MSIPEHDPNGWSPRDANDWSSQSYQGLFDQRLNDQLVGGWDVANSRQENGYTQSGPEGEQ